MRRRLPIVVLVVLALACSVWLTAVTWGQSGEYKIGVLEPLTGPLAGEGKRHLEGFEVVRDLINERGGVMGKKLSFVVADVPDPTAAATEANRLITRENVKILTGTFSSRPGTMSSTGRPPASTRASTSAASRTSTAPRSMRPGSAGTTSTSSSSTSHPASISSPAS